MGEQSEIAALRDRLALIEAENAALRSVAEQKPPRNGSRPGRRWVSGLAAALVIVSMLLAPVALIGTWARAQLVDTERFVATVAPLAEEAAVQELLTDQVMAGIDDNVDVDGLIGDVFTGLADLDLPREAKATLPLLQGPAAEGVRSIIRGGVERVIVSPQFAQLWETVLRHSHAQAIAVLQEDPDAAFELAADGTLSLRLEPLITEVKEVLVAQGFGFADAIPTIERSIPIVEADALVTVRALYQVSVAAGYLLPWVTLVLLVAGVVLARRKMRALAWAGAGFALSFLLLGAGMGVGRAFFIGTISPSVMPAPTAAVLFDQVTMAISSLVGALVMLSVFVMLGAWVAGGSQLAQRLRGSLESLFGAARRGLDRHGLDTRGAGTFVERWHAPLMVATVLIATVVLFMIRPITATSVITTLIIVAVVAVLIELVRRPPAVDAELTVTAV